MTAVLPLPLQDRVAIVAGGFRGIGRAIFFHLASLGAPVVINYSNSAEAQSLPAQINSNSSATPGPIAVHADVSDPDQVIRLFDAAEATSNSPTHVAVNSAGVIDATFPQPRQHFARGLRSNVKLNN